MKTIGLIGGNDIAKYTIADKLWDKVSEVSKYDFDFRIIPISEKKKVVKFLKKFKEDEDFLGFNVALPWKYEIAKLVNDNSGIINTVFKKDNQIRAINTDVYGVEFPLLKRRELRKGMDILILGAGGAGTATAKYLIDKYDVNVYLYDVKQIHNSSCSTMLNYKDISSNTYDIIVNATPLGKYYLDKKISEFSSPLNLSLLKEISKKSTIVFEMNYLPKKTLLLEMASNLGLCIIPGYEMLTYQALESFSYYFQTKINQEETESVLESINSIINNTENQIYFM